MCGYMAFKAVTSKHKQRKFVSIFPGFILIRIGIEDSYLWRIVYCSQKVLDINTDTVAGVGITY